MAAFSLSLTATHWSCPPLIDSNIPSLEPFLCSWEDWKPRKSRTCPPALARGKKSEDQSAHQMECLSEPHCVHLGSFSWLSDLYSEFLDKPWNVTHNLALVGHLCASSDYTLFPTANSHKLKLNLSSPEDRQYWHSPDSPVATLSPPFLSPWAKCLLNQPQIFLASLDRNLYS